MILFSQINYCVHNVQKFQGNFHRSIWEYLWWWEIEGSLEIHHRKEGKGREVAQSCPTLCDPMDGSLHQAPPSMGFLGKSTGVGCHFLLQGIFPTQGSNPGLLHCRQTLYRLSHQRIRSVQYVAHNEEVFSG